VPPVNQEKPAHGAIPIAPEYMGERFSTPVAGDAGSLPTNEGDWTGDDERRNKLASLVQVGDPLGRALAKLAFSVTEEGHKYDAERAKLDAAHSSNIMELAQRYGGMGSAKGTGSLRKALRGFDAAYTTDPRHDEYRAKKHKEGKNAWNPLGGANTPSSREVGGTKWRYGKFKKAEADPLLQYGDAAGRAVAALYTRDMYKEGKLNPP